MSKPVPVFRTTNWSSYSQALKRRGSLMVWFDPEMSWFAVPDGKPGHPERFSAAAIQFCLAVKVLFGLPLRQATGCVESLLSLSGLDWPVPDYTALCRRQKYLKVQTRIVRPPGRCICWWTALGSSSRAKASGRSASMEPAAVASGARSTSELMRKLWKFARWR